MQDFIAKVKAAPGKYNFASTGNGTGTHLAFAQFVKMAGLDMVHVPYKGGPEALQAVVTGEMCCIMNQVQTVLRPMAAPARCACSGVTTKQRVGAVQEVPTIDEAGLPGYESYIWFGLFGPKGLDAAITEKINLAVKKALDLPAVREKLVQPRQRAALRDRRAVPRHRKGRPRQVGRGGEGVRGVDRLSGSPQLNHCSQMQRGAEA